MSVGSNKGSLVSVRPDDLTAQMIRAVLDHLFRQPLHLVTAQQCPDLAAQGLRQLLTFCQQFQADLGELAAILLDEYPNISFCHVGTFILRCIP